MPHHKIQLLYYLQVSCNKIHTTFNIFYREKDRGREKFELTTLLALCTYEERFQISNRLCYSKLKTFFFP